MTLVITGANGEFGRIALDSTIAAAPGERVIASVCNPERAIDLIERGSRFAQDHSTILISSATHSREPTPSW